MPTRREFLACAAGAATLGSARRGPVVDAHMHVWSDDPARFPFAHPYEPDFKPPKIAATAELCAREMDESGIRGCVLVQTIYHGWDNRYLVRCLRGDPKRFRAQGLADPTDPKVADRLEYGVKEQGLSGLRFSPMYYRGRDGWMITDPARALWKRAADLKAILNFFIAADQLPKLEEMVRAHPDVRVVVDHLGRIDLKGPDPEGDLRKLLALARHARVWVKVSELNIISPSGRWPYRDTFPWVKRVAEAFGPDRLLWGTGFPGATRAQAGRPSLTEELDIIRKEIPFFTAPDREKILGLNAARLWGFDAD